MNSRDSEALSMLLQATAAEPDWAVRMAALDAASRLARTKREWKSCADKLLPHVRNRENADTRQAALRIAVRIPLLSMRQELRQIAEAPDDPNREAAAALLNEVGDPSRIHACIEQVGKDHGDSFRFLAKMPVEDHLRTDDIPALPEAAVPSSSLWHSLTLARLGVFKPLDQILTGETPEPELFWGSPWSAYDDLAALRPVPSALQEHLLAYMANVDHLPKAGQLIVWALTGEADAQGQPIARPIRTSETRAPSEEAEKRAIAISERLHLGRKFPPEQDVAELRYLPSGQGTLLVKRLMREGNAKASRWRWPVAPNVMLGNQIIGIIAHLPESTKWPSADLLLEHMMAEHVALDDDQVAWIIARDDLEHLIQEVVAIAHRETDPSRRLRMFDLLGRAADAKAGRMGFPVRGAGPGTAPFRPRELIDDYEKTTVPQEVEVAVVDTTAADERTVNAQIWYNGKRRETFVAGAKNIIRCWIGLPDPSHAATASEPIQVVDIPPEGLELNVQLLWRGQFIDRKVIVLPPERTARTADCDLALEVRDSDRTVSVQIAFLYRGRVFEFVEITASALAPHEAEDAYPKLQMRVDASRRQTIEVSDTSQYDAAIIVRAPPDDQSKTGALSLLVFGEGPGELSFPDGSDAVKALHGAISNVETLLVRRHALLRNSHGVETETEALDPNDSDVLNLLRVMAQHGSNLFNQLSEQGFGNLGERLQVITRTAKEAPIEFVYDRGFPADNATLCEGWYGALMSDAHHCPSCGAHEQTAEERSWASRICPLGFWSLQKIVERLAPRDFSCNSAAPTREHRILPAIDSALFASSHLVPLEERDKTWAALKKRIPGATFAENWSQWHDSVENHPSLLVVLPHHGVAVGGLDYLQIGAEQLPPRLGRLSRGQLTADYVNPGRLPPGPIVVLLGCSTGTGTEGGFAALTKRFHQEQASIVLGTLAEVLGRHAAPVARELIEQLMLRQSPIMDFGFVMRRVRRRMLARGYLMALNLVALGDAEWRLPAS